MPAFVSNHPPEVVDPVWLIKAIGLIILAALICGYLTFCLLFYQGQWQLVLHPSRDTPAPATIAGTAFETIHFAVDESAAPQLTGWWIPSAPGGRYAAHTILYLPSGDGSLANSVPALAALHAIGINIFAFDYRGYGQSAPLHPNQIRMNEDAASAWQYLTQSRAIPPVRLIPFGVGVGAALAVQLAAQHTELPAVVLQSPLPNLLHAVLADPRTRPLPVRALFHDRFEIAASLAVLKTPKLFLIAADKLPLQPIDDPAAIQGMVNSASDPKVASTMNAEQLNGPVYMQQIKIGEIKRFLDQYLR